MQSFYFNLLWITIVLFMWVSDQIFWHFVSSVIDLLMNRRNTEVKRINFVGSDCVSTVLWLLLLPCITHHTLGQKERRQIIKAQPADGKTTIFTNIKWSQLQLNKRGMLFEAVCLVHKPIMTVNWCKIMTIQLKSAYSNSIELYYYEVWLYKNKP